MTEPAVTTKFTVSLDAATNTRFDQLVGELGRVTGALPSHRGRRRPGRADLLRAALAVLEGNRALMAEVRNQVLYEALAPRASDELRGLAAELHRGAAWMSTPESQDALAEVAAGLERLDPSHVLDDPQGDNSDGDVAAAADELHTLALRVARLGATAGGYEGLRLLLDIARRVELVRDAIDPAEMRVCLHCSQDVRLGDDGRFEPHTAQAGDMCPGGQR